MTSDRAADAQRRVELAAATARREAAEAQTLIDQFVADAVSRGLAPVALQATTFDGKRVKTDKRGWYIRQNHGLAIGEDGGFYVLVVPGGWRQRLNGVKLQPSQPSLTIGKGGRDGETGELKDFLARTLAGQVAQH